MTDDSVWTIHQRKIQQVADEYKARGYRVLVEPSASELPPFLADFHPDLIAYGPQDSVVVEVKVGTETAVSEHYGELAERIRQHPGWRFSLTVIDPRSDEVVPLTQQLLDREAIMGRLREARELLDRGVKDAAFVLLWSAVEALLRQIASREGLPLERVPSSAVLKELFSLGLISRSGLDIAMRAFSVRNSLVHGFEAPELNAVLEGMTPLVQELLAEFDQAGSKTA